MRRIGIYGGTFNPPHLGHMAAAHAAAEQLALDELILIPDRTPPHKQLPEGSASAQQRLDMTRLAADRLGLGKKVHVSQLELKRAGKSYTADTIRVLHEQNPDAELWLLVGTDMFLTIHEWYQPEVIFSLAKLAAFGREAGDEAGFDRQKQYLEQRFGAAVQVIAIPNLVEVSSTKLREALRQGGGAALLDTTVYGYILRHQLYGTHTDLKHLTLEQLRAVSYAMVKAKRIPHIQGTEEEAALLARRWGADETAARKAAILHDCTKYWTLEEHLKICEKCGILLDCTEQNTLPLLHAKSGSAVAELVFGMPEEICQAIRWHTTGRADMTLLDKILYIADYAEPNRPYPWAAELRHLVLEDLDRAVLRGMEITIEHNTEKGVPVYYRTLAARDFIARQLTTERN